MNPGAFSHSSDFTPQVRRGYPRLPFTAWVGVFCRAPLTGRRLQIVATVIRERWGWSDRKGRNTSWTRPLTTRAVAGLTGLSVSRLAGEIRRLARRGVLVGHGVGYAVVPNPHGRIPLSQNCSVRAPKWRQNGVEGVPPSSHYIEKRVKRKGSTVPAAATPVPLAMEWLQGPTGPRIEERLLRILLYLAEPLTEKEYEAARAWVRAEGSERVWRSVQAALRKGRAGAREEIRGRLKGAE